MSEQLSTGQEPNFLLFHLEWRAFALSHERVIQIIPMLRLAPLPGAGRIVEGFANIHGEIVPMLSARRRLGLPFAETSPNAPIILVRAHRRTLGLLVDRIEGYVALPPERVETVDTLMPEGLDGQSVLKKVLYLEDRHVFLLEPDHLLKPGQAQAVNAAVEGILARGGDA